MYLRVSPCVCVCVWVSRLTDTTIFKLKSYTEKERHEKKNWNWENEAAVLLAANGAHNSQRNAREKKSDDDNITFNGFQSTIEIIMEAPSVLISIWKVHRLNRRRSICAWTLSLHWTIAWISIFVSFLAFAWLNEYQPTLIDVCFFHFFSVLFQDVGQENVQWSENRLKYLSRFTHKKQQRKIMWTIFKKFNSKWNTKEKCKPKVEKRKRRKKAFQSLELNAAIDLVFVI